MMVRKAFNYRLYPTQQQQERLEWVLRRCQELYNAALYQRRESQVCSGCGRPVPKTLSERWHTCPYGDCGLSLQRDHNSARAILNRAGLARAGV
jgi:transposase